MRNRIKQLMKTAPVFAGLLLMVSCNEPTLDSAWRPSDAAESAQSKYSSYILNGEDVVVALQNDEQNLYLRIKATNTASQMKMTSGLTVWLDADGKKKKEFGIQYPIPRSEMMPPGGGKQGGRGERPGGEPPNMSGGFEKPGSFMGMGMPNKDSLIIIGPEKNKKHTLGIDNEYGITASITRENGPLIYDLTIPLERSDDNPYAVGFKPGKLIAIGIETATSKSRSKGRDEGDHPKRGGDGDSFGGSGGGSGPPGGFGDGGDWGGDGDWGGGSGGSGGGPPGGGMGGGPPGGGGRGPGGGKQGPGGSDEMKSSPVKFWAKIRLAHAGQSEK
jgi:hypothetical protein